MLGVIPHLDSGRVLGYTALALMNDSEKAKVGSPKGVPAWRTAVPAILKDAARATHNP